MTSKERHTFLITVAVMATTVMQVLDMTIVNVALPHMEGSLSATNDQIAWVLTSYLVSSAIFMPLTGYFTDRLGQKKYLLLSIAGFMIASALCGLSTSLAEIVLFRILQGVFGAALVPLSQSIMVQTYPVEERGKAMAIWGMGVMVGPILGPTLGGYLTEVLTWRWTFFINIPVGLFSFLLATRVVPDSERKERDMDWTGLLLLAVAVGGLQYVLDRGNQDNWFDSHLILSLTVISTAAFVAFIYYAWHHKGHVIFRLAIFADRNFAVSSFLITLIGIGLFGSMLLQPLMMENLMNYPVLDTGLVMAPRGLASMFSMMLVSRLSGKVDPRLMILVGITFATGGSWMMTQYTMVLSMSSLIVPMVLQGLGMGLIFAPLAAVAYATLAPQFTAEAAGMFSLLRTVGSSIGISALSTLLARHTQVSWNQLGANIDLSNPALHDFLARQQMELHNPLTAQILARMVQQQAFMIALLDCFLLVTVSFVAMYPFILLLGKNKSNTPSAAPGGAAMD
ncbi:MAG: DHA2 family efflux MFS transporter permease subunit [Gammaproteobacteria bacterium]|jgi:DHA2 family multidrug resistance protein